MITNSTGGRDLPNTTLFKINVRSIRSLRAATFGRPGKDVPVNIACLVAAKHVQSSNPLYFLQAVRSNARDPKSGSFLCEAEYKQIESYAAGILATGLRECPFDAVLAAPTSRRDLQKPYLDAIHSLKPGVPDLTADVMLADPDVNSRSDHGIEERIANLSWPAGKDWLALKHILIVDDVVSQGRTAVPLIHSIRDQCSPSHEPAFTVCSPLWIIRDDAKSWLKPV